MAIQNAQANSQKQPTPDDYKKMMREYFDKQLLREYAGCLMTKGMFFERQNSTAPDPYHFIAAAEQDMTELQTVAGGRGYSKKQEQEAIRALQEGGFELFHAPQHLASRFMQADVEVKRIELAFHRQQFGSVAIQHPHLQGCKNYFLGEGDGVNAPVLTLRQVVDRFLETKASEIRDRSLHRVRKTLEKLIDLLGENRAITTIYKQPDGVFLESIVNKIPLHFKRDYKGQDLKSFIQKGGSYKTISPQTAAGYWATFQEFFSWATARDFLPRNPIDGLTSMTVKRGKEKPRYNFSDEQLKIMFNSPIYTGRKNIKRSLWEKGNILRKDGYFWVPLVSLFTGMRETEIIKLKPEDIKEDEGILYFDIHTPEELKTAHSVRKVPVHPELIKIGIRKYVEHRRKAAKPNEYLFEDSFVIPRGQPIIKNFSRTFSDYTMRVGVRVKKDGKSVFHSFRHNMQTALAIAGVSEGESCHVIGHDTPKEKQTTGSRVYDHSIVPLTRLHSYVCKVSYGVDLSHLYETEE